jgi:hypothetical protein
MIRATAICYFPARQDAQIDPVAPIVVANVQCQGYANGGNAKEKQIEAGLMQTRSHHTGIDGVPKQKDTITCIKV